MLVVKSGTGKVSPHPFTEGMRLDFILGWKEKQLKVRVSPSSSKALPFQRKHLLGNPERQGVGLTKSLSRYTHTRKNLGVGRFTETGIWGPDN